jgi:hypothetical protein
MEASVLGATRIDPAGRFCFSTRRYHGLAVEDFGHFDVSPYRDAAMPKSNCCYNVPVLPAAVPLLMVAGWPVWAATQA